MKFSGYNIAVGYHIQCTTPLVGNVDRVHDVRVLREGLDRVPYSFNRKLKFSGYNIAVGYHIQCTTPLVGNVDRVHDVRVYVPSKHLNLARCTLR